MADFTSVENLELAQIEAGYLLGDAVYSYERPLEENDSRIVAADYQALRAALEISLRISAKIEARRNTERRGFGRHNCVRHAISS